jgi:hypothetical protein
MFLSQKIESAVKITTAAAATLVMLLVASVSADAKTLYVNASTGNDSTTYAANGPSAPWRTIGRAAWGSTSRSAPNANEAARAGDVVMIAAGTYTTVGYNNRWEVAYNPANSGTAAAPIRFQGQGVVNLTYSSGAGPMIGANNRNYIQWSGFTLNESTAPTVSDTGPVVFFGADYNYVQGGSLENSTLTGNPNWTTREGDNYNGIRLEYANGQRIYNNVIRNYGGDTDTGGGGIDHNHSGMTTYKWENLTVENNVFDNCGSGMYLKATQTTTREVGVNTIRRNIFSNNRHGIHVHRAPNTATEPIVISQNVFYDNQHGVRILMFNDATDPMHVKIINNAFDNNTVGSLVIGTSGNIPTNAGYVFWNNVVYGGPHAILIQHPSSNVISSKIDAEHNLYYGMSTFAEIGGSNTTFATWQGTYAMDTDDGGSADGVWGTNPNFVNRGGRDYRLSSGSAAQSLGRVHPTYPIGGGAGATIPAGPYISGSDVIGPTGSTSTPPAPAAPLNVRIVR